MTDWLSTILILLPIAGALVVWLVPLPRYWVGSLATLVSLIEIGFWITARAALRLRRRRRSSSTSSTRGSASLGVSYHVGQFGFSLWLVGLTVVVRRRRAAATPGGPAASGRARTSGCCSS